MTFPGNVSWCGAPYLKFQPSHNLSSRSIDVINLVKGQCTERPKKDF